jgi:hyperosmotically inducible periplasmic protein
MHRSLMTVALCVLVMGTISRVQAQDGKGEAIGKKIDRGVTQLGEELRQTWAEIRKTAERMGVESRVYVRLHWDKATHDAAIEIEVRSGGVVVLKGSVSDPMTKATAVRLAQDTVGVSEVIDELAVASGKVSKQ